MALYDAAVSIPLVTVDRDGFLASLGTGTFYDIAPATPTLSLVVGADLPVEWEGSFDLLFQWYEYQLLFEDLFFSWTEVPVTELINGDLPFSWIETSPVEDLLFTWVELPAQLLNAYELDPQRPYGRVTKP